MMALERISAARKVVHSFRDLRQANLQVSLKPLFDLYVFSIAQTSQSGIPTFQG